MTAGGQPFWVAMVVEGQGLRPFLPVILNEMVEHVGLPLLPLVLLLLVLNVTVVRRALQPLSAAVGEVEALQPGQIERRLAMPEAPREVRRLVGALNDALDRIESGIGALRDFTADAAHELRTPLAIMSMEVDALADGPAKDKLRSDLDAMTRAVAQMLDMASADALADRRRCPASISTATAWEIVAQLTPLALRQQRSLRFIDGGAPHDCRPSRGHRPRLAQSDRKRTGPHAGRQRHRCDGRARRHRSSCATTDRALPPSQRDAVLKRFWRADRSNNAGSGLGLAIASRIAEAHGGRSRSRMPPAAGRRSPCGLPKPENPGWRISPLLPPDARVIHDRPVGHLWLNHGPPRRSRRQTPENPGSCRPARFAEVGYEAASMDGLAAAAGVSKGSLYDYFENKEDLFYASSNGSRQQVLATSMARHARTAPMRARA